MKLLFLITFLMSFGLNAQEIKLKAATNLKIMDIGAELHMKSFNPTTDGVFGVDLEDGMARFNFGVNKKFGRLHIMPFLGFGLVEITKTNGRATTGIYAVSSQGCSNGKGKGVQRNCSSGNNGNSGNSGNNGNGNGNSGNNGNSGGNGNGNSGGNGNGNGNSGNSGNTGGNGGSGNTGGNNGSGSSGTTTPSTPTAYTTTSTRVMQEFGVRIVPRFNKSLNPMIEFSTATIDGGLNFDQTIKAGIIFDF